MVGPGFGFPVHSTSTHDRTVMNLLTARVRDWAPRVAAACMKSAAAQGRFATKYEYYRPA